MTDGHDREYLPVDVDDAKLRLLMAQRRLSGDPGEAPRYHPDMVLQRGIVDIGTINTTVRFRRVPCVPLFMSHSLLRLCRPLHRTLIIVSVMNVNGKPRHDVIGHWPISLRRRKGNGSRLDQVWFPAPAFLARLVEENGARVFLHRGEADAKLRPILVFGEC